MSRSLTWLALFCSVTLACNELLDIDHIEFSDAVAQSGTTGQGGAGGAGGIGMGGSATSTGGTAVVGDFAYRRRIDVTASSPLVLGHNVGVTIDHGQWVADGMSRPDGNDVRIYREDSNGPAEELPRVADPDQPFDSPGGTLLWFALPEAAANGTPPSTYYVYYGAPNAGPAAGDPAQIYLAWDDFGDGALDPAWTETMIGSLSYLIQEAGGVLHIEGAGGNYGGTSDSFALLHRPLSGDFIAEVSFATVTPGGSGYAVLGGVTVRRSTASTSAHMSMVKISGPSDYARVNRAADMGTSGNNVFTSMSNSRRAAVIRQGDTANGLYLAPDNTYTPAGSGVTFAAPLMDPVLVGIPFADGGVPLSSVDIAWFRALHAPLPTVALGSEEIGPFQP